MTTSQSPSSGRGTPTSRNGAGTNNDSAGGLFLEDKKGLAKLKKVDGTLDANERTRSRTPDDIWGDENEFPESEDLRYHEKDSSVKRRKVDSPDTTAKTTPPDTDKKPNGVKKTNKGPFIDESDSEDDMDAYREQPETSPAPIITNNDEMPPIANDEVSKDLAEPEQPPPVRDATTDTRDEGYVNFDELEEEEFIGEEFLDKPWEECELEGPNNESGFDDMTDSINGETNSVTCPICQISLAGNNENVSSDPQFDIDIRIANLG